MFCPKCGNQLPDGAAFCPKCGARLTAPKKEAQPSANVQKAKPVQSVSADSNDFKKFVDDHVRATTKFSSAEDLLKNSKPWAFTWICFGVSILVWLLLYLKSGTGSEYFFLCLFFGLFFGYPATVIASGIIRRKYRRRFGGNFFGAIDMNDFCAFLNEHLQSISPDFHEWGFLSSKGGFLTTVANKVATDLKEVHICAEFGPKRKRLVEIWVRPKERDAESGEQWYGVDADKNGFLWDGRAGEFYAHGTLIRTAPILQAAMEYYLKIR